MTQRAAFFPLRGGLDLVTPAIETQPGAAIAALNYESVYRGYQRIDGYERFDGHPKPSEASYWLLDFENGSAAIDEGDVIEGGTSGATARVLVDAVVLSGDWSDGDAAGYLVLTNVVGTFASGEAIEIATVPVAVTDGTARQQAAVNADEDRAWSQMAIEAARANISAIPGSGPVRGIHIYKGDVYAWRDNAGATAGVMHKATASGWQAITLSRVLAFEDASAAFTEGATVTGGTSGASATILRVVLQSGSYSGGDGEGYLVIGTVAGGPFQAAEALSDGGGGSGKALAADAAITLAPGGRYEAVNHNFFASSATQRMYAVNGVGAAFEFDGTTLVPIRVPGLTDALDKPRHLAVYRQRLCLAYAGGRVLYSIAGSPYGWDATEGAGEIGFGEDITGLLSTVGVLLFYGQRRISIFSGTSNSDFVLAEFSDDSGAFEWTVQRLESPIHCDRGGIRTLETSDAFGDFARGTLTRAIEPLVKALFQRGRLPVASIASRVKESYRLFYDDGSGFSVYLGRLGPETGPECMPFEYADAPVCTAVGDDAEGRELLLFGDGTGMVYQLDAGTSFDGEEVEAFIRWPWNHLGSPSQNKRFHKLTLEADIQPGSKLGLVSEFSYAAPSTPPSMQVEIQQLGDGAFFDHSVFDEAEFMATDLGEIEGSGAGAAWDEGVWDEFYWSSPREGLVETHISGLGRNISIVAFSTGTYAPPHTFHGLTVHYSNRGLQR